MRILEPGGRHLEVGGDRTRLVGILNVTPDSFYDGGRYAGAVEAAVAHGTRLAAAGADVIDVGGESTRPGHTRVEPEEQLRRILPVVTRLVDAVDVPISVDTTRARVAAACLDAGAHWINDTSAFTEDEALAPLCAERGCPVVLMHRFVPQREPGDAAAGRSVVDSIADRLRRRVEHALAAGVAAGQIVLDPGIGFGTLPDDNVQIHAFLEPLQSLGFPLLLGPSRKSFLGHISGRGVDDRLWATAASVACLALSGVELVRVHDVAEMRDVVDVADSIRRARHAPSREVAC